jgi:hypothetical protein
VLPQQRWVNALKPVLCSGDTSQHGPQSRPRVNPHSITASNAAISVSCEVEHACSKSRRKRCCHRGTAYRRLSRAGTEVDVHAKHGKIVIIVLRLRIHPGRGDLEHAVAGKDAEDVILFASRVCNTGLCISPVRCCRENQNVRFTCSLNCFSKLIVCREEAGRDADDINILLNSPIDTLSAVWSANGPMVMIINLDEPSPSAKAPSHHLCNPSQTLCPRKDQDRTMLSRLGRLILFHEKCCLSYMEKLVAQSPCSALRVIQRGLDQAQYRALRS